jgi:stage V sporulation protein B
MKGKNKISDSIIKGTLSLTISTLIVKLLGLIYKIPLANILGDEGMGFFNSAYTVYSFFFLLCTAGVPKAIMILVSSCKAKNDSEEVSRIISIAMRLFLCIGVVISLIFAIFSGQLASLIGNSQARATMIAVAPSIIFISLASVVRGYLSADMRLFEIAVSQIIEGVGKLAVGLIFACLSARANMPLQIISAMTILGVSFGSLVGLLYLIAISKIKIKRYKTGQNGIIRKIFRISLPITVSAAIMSLTNVIDLGLIMRSLEHIGYTEAESAAMYGNYTTLAVPMLNLALAIISPISIAYLPVFTKAITTNDYELLEQSETSALKLASFIASPMLVGLIVYSREILSILFPSSSADVGAMLLCLLCPAIVFSSSLLIINNSLEAGGRVRAPLISMSLGCVVKILVSYFLIRNPAFGISGAPIGTVCSYATALLVSTIIYRIEYNRSIDVFYGYLPSIVFSVTAVLLSRILYNSLYFKLGQITLLAVSIILCAALYFGISALYELVKGKGKIELAKYTNFDHLNCKIDT